VLYFSVLLSVLSEKFSRYFLYSCSIYQKMGVFGKLRRRRRVPAVDVSLTKDGEKRGDVSVKGTYVASLAFRFSGNFQPC